MTGKPAIGVIGLGTMGLGIAQLYAQAGHRVIATDAQAAVRAAAATRLGAALEGRVAAGKLAPAARDATLANFALADDAAALAPARLVIEAVVERLEVKQALFAGLERHVAADAVLATNTSSLSVAAIMSRLARPERGLGLHFFNPVPAMKLAELVAQPATSAAALAVARRLTEAAGKTVIACADRPGFIVNRVGRPFYGEALVLLEEGRSASAIDAAMLAAGYRMGPFTLMDLIGADISLAASEGMAAAMGRHPRYAVAEALKAQVAKGDLGRKTGRGFLFPESPSAAPADAAEIALRIEATLANEAGDLLGEGGLSPPDIDTALKLGLNFPRGPFEAARAHGPGRIISTLKALEARAPPRLKGRYVVTPALERLT